MVKPFIQATDRPVMIFPDLYYEKLLGTLYFDKMFYMYIENEGNFTHENWKKGNRLYIMGYNECVQDPLPKLKGPIINRPFLSQPPPKDAAPPLLNMK